jgi:hypothetical protein
MIVIGVDVHKHSLTAVAVDELGRTVAARSGPVDAEILEWARTLGADRLWALEDCRHVTRTLERTLLRAGEVTPLSGLEFEATSSFIRSALPRPCCRGLLACQDRPGP